MQFQLKARNEQTILKKKISVREIRKESFIAKRTKFLKIYFKNLGKLKIYNTEGDNLWNFFF